jgi:hypothetical protein
VAEGKRPMSRREGLSITKPEHWRVDSCNNLLAPVQSRLVKCDVSVSPSGLSSRQRYRATGVHSQAVFYVLANFNLGVFILDADH